MKKRVLLMGVIAFLLLVAGCSSEEDALREADEKVQKEAEKLAQALTKEEYEKTAIDLTNEYYDLMKELAEKRESLSLIGEEEITWLHDKLDELLAKGEEITALKPPIEYKEVDGYFESAIKEFTVYVNGFKKDLDEQNTDLGINYAENLIKGQEFYDYARTLIAMEYDYVVPDSDGTITMQDLEDLDLAAGYDRDSVILNLSKNGKELIGKWGFYNEDGTFNVSIVLNEDGSYEGYGNGDYPDKNNYMIGTWDYNYLTRELTFVHDTKYTDGQPQDYSETRTMDVLLFKDSTIKMMDLATTAIFTYVKEGTPNTTGVEDTNAATTTTAEDTSTSSQSYQEADFYGYWDDSAAEYEDYFSLSLNEGGYGTVFTYKKTIFGTWKYDTSNNTLRFTPDDGSADLVYPIIEVSGKTLTIQENENTRTLELSEF